LHLDFVVGCNIFTSNQLAGFFIGAYSRFLVNTFYENLGDETCLYLVHKNCSLVRRNEVFMLKLKIFFVSHEESKEEPQRATQRNPG
jgi:hypothetical protein